MSNSYQSSRTAIGSGENNVTPGRGTSAELRLTGCAKYIVQRGSCSWAGDPVRIGAKA